MEKQLDEPPLWMTLLFVVILCIFAYGLSRPHNPGLYDPTFTTSVEYRWQQK